MENAERKVWRVLLAWLLLAATLLVAALLIWQCLDIYLTGTAAENIAANGTRIHDVYSRDMVAQRLRTISWAFLVWGILFVATLIARIGHSAEKPSIPALPLENRLELLRARTIENADMCAEQRHRFIAKLALGAISGVCLLMVVLYFVDLSHFSSRELEGVVSNMLLYCSPFVAIALAAWMIYEQIAYASMAREIEAAKSASKREPEPPVRQFNRCLTIGRIVLYVVAAAFVVAGVLNGGLRDVLIKAINICQECIGLG